MSTAADDLPELCVAELDDATLRELLEEVAHETELLGVTLKGAATLRADEHLARTHAELVAHHLVPLRATLGSASAPHGIQLRYRHEGRVVYDTLLRTGDRWRLTRLAPPHAQR